MKPLFMWAGGKNKMLKKYAKHLPTSVEHYVEPFLGGGAMFIWAYKLNPEAEFVLNDYNESVMAVYRAIKNDINPFIKRMDELQEKYMPLDKAARKKFYYDLREEHAFDYKKWTRTEEAASLYFLMKTGFNGIWQINKNTGGRFGTPSGLLNQKTKVYDKDNVLAWHKALQRCKLMSGDYKETFPEVKSNSYVFLDPPYRGSFTQYGVDFDDKMQNGVIKYLNDSTALGAYALMSNRDVGDGFFEARVGKNDIVYFDVTYTAGRRKKEADGSHSAKKAREILMIGKQ
tara:strand:- start:675 stop:1535 length:861 start_codon:yes stop_codon:yes gene_type:complete